VPVFVCFRNSCSHVTEVGSYGLCHTGWRFPYKWRGLYVINPATPLLGFHLFRPTLFLFTI